MSFRVAIDTGGTFTDGISVDGEGNVVTVKERTTPQDFTIGFLGSLARLAKGNNLDLRTFLGEVSTILHGTTVGANVIVTRSGPKLGIIATKGHRDALELRRVVKENIFDWKVPFPEPLVPRYLRVEVEERVGSRGNVVIPLNEDSVHQAVSYLKKEGVEGIVVAFLFSFLYPAHERRVAEIIEADYPEADITLSSHVLPASGEFERTSTAAISAYIGPSLRKFIKTLTALLEREGFKGELLFMQNNGGVETAEIAMETPATLAMSGPAAGPTAAIVIGNLHGEKNLISVDLGGTSFDCGIVYKGNCATRTESLIADTRFSLPVLDVKCIGAGGGSIAWFDAANALHVGPQSVGAYPGPACYGSGGQEATVTDADVILGYISPDFFLGGEIPLREDLAQKAIKEKVADRLGLSIVDGAAAIYKIINSVMANSLSYTFTRRGYDPRDFALCVGGAAGPVHAVRVMQELGIPRVLIPRLGPIYCASGMLGVDLRHDYARFYQATWDTLDLGRVKELYAEMEAEGIKTLQREGVSEEQQVWVRLMGVRYYGQFGEIEVPWPSGEITKEAISAGVAAFHVKHRELYGYSDENYPIQLSQFKLTAIGKMPRIQLKEIERGGEDSSPALKGKRDVFFEEAGGFVKTPIYDGDRLLCGNILEGPCVVEERKTTVVIPPKFRMRIDEYGNYASI